MSGIKFEGNENQKYEAVATLYTRFLRMIGWYPLFRNMTSPSDFYGVVRERCDTCNGMVASLFMVVAYRYFIPICRNTKPKELGEILVVSQLFRFYLLESLEEVCKIYQIESNEASEIIVKSINRNEVSSLMREWLDDFENGKKIKIDYDYEKLLRKN